MQIFLMGWDGNLVYYYHAIAVLGSVLVQEHHRLSVGLLF